MANNQMVWDWTTPEGDTQSLFRDARASMGINYKADVVRLTEFQYNPESVPIMYLTSHQGFALNLTQRQALRHYVLAGGAILGAAGGGEEGFSEAFVNEMRAMFPDRPWFVLPPDHPALPRLPPDQFGAGAPWPGAIFVRRAPSGRDQYRLPHGDPAVAGRSELRLGRPRSPRRLPGEIRRRQETGDRHPGLPARLLPVGAHQFGAHRLQGGRGDAGRDRGGTDYP